MTANREAPRFIALTRVKPERADDFETFVREVVMPALAQARPQAAGLWQTLRPDPGAEPTQLDDTGGAAAAASTYVFVFYGDLPLADWDLGSVFAEVHGEEQGSHLIEQFEDLLDGDQVVVQFSGQV